MATAADILGVNGKTRIPARWALYHRRLCAERDRLLERDCSAPTAASAKLDDLSDAAADESQRSISLVTATATQGRLFEVLEAIRRIERGRYGICEVTGQPIEPERLRVIPWARYSLKGQEELERSGFDRRLTLPALQSISEPEGAPDEENEGQETAA